MYKSIKSFPQQFLAQFPVGDMPTKARHIVIAGMGGSAIPAVILNDYLQSLGVSTLTLLRDYRLPKWVNSEDLVICSSYSGNTEETLSVYEEAKSKKIAIASVTHGGTLLSKSKSDGVPLILLPECVQPRCATGFFNRRILDLSRKAWKNFISK